MRLVAVPLLALASSFVLACASAPPPEPKAAPPAITAAALPASTPSAPAAFTWPTPEKWRSETIPFPLDFAPALPYGGVEELRFAPGFFKPEEPGYWSYAFVWWIASGPELTQGTVETHLRDYFVGLTSAVAKGKFEPDLGRIGAHLAPSGPSRWEGSLRTVDAFKTRQEVDLKVRASAGTCGDHRFLLVSASPKPAGDPIWASLDAVTTSFTCR